MILVAAADRLTCRRLESSLKKDGHAVTATTDATLALEIMRSDVAPELAILDVLMPGVGALELCRLIRQVPRAVRPHIILLTVKGGRGGAVEGLKAVADDFLVKPFDRAELRARVSVGEQMLQLKHRLVGRVSELEALARARRQPGHFREDRYVYEFGPFRLDAGERRLRRGDQVLTLTPKVLDLLLLLVQNAGRLVEKNEIMSELWPDREVEENNLTVSMSALRKALAGGGGDYIETVPKRGYRFSAEVRRLS